MKTLTIDGSTFRIHREFNENGSSILAQTVNYLLDLANSEEEPKQNQDKED